METSFRQQFLRERLLTVLARRGPCSAVELTRELEISQPTLSRLLATVADRVLFLGRTRNRRYALARDIPAVRQPVAVFEVRRAGEPILRIGELHAAGDRAFAFESGGKLQFFDDLPWFLNNARPSGFLGRLVPRRHPELGLPADIRFWSGDHVVQFASRYGWDLPGAFIIGDDACALFISESAVPSNLIDANDRAVRYPAVVSDLLSFGTAGSSAAGEQPKFLATIRDGETMKPVLVKYSSPIDNAAGRRIADLLIAEQVALETLGAAGFAVPQCSLSSFGQRVFLEIVRFDRLGQLNRVGLVSLDVLDAEFAGTDMISWSASAGVLASRGVIPATALPRIRWLETFGRFIANTDMHLGNLSFLMDRTRVIDLAPVYDMLPMHYYPIGDETPVREFKPHLPRPEMSDVARPALNAAIEYWSRLASDLRISDGFRNIALDNARTLVDMRPSVDVLPGR